MSVPFLLEMQKTSGVVPVQLQERLDPSFEYKYELPEKWLGYETWHVKEALLLLAGLQPDYTTVDTVENSIQIESGALILGGNCEEIFGEYCVYNKEMCEQDELFLRGRIDAEEYKLIRQYPRTYIYEELSSEAQKYIRNARMVACYDRASSLLEIFWGSWKRRKESDIDSIAELEKKYPVETFLKWAVEIKRTGNISWWTNTLTDKHISEEETHQGGEKALGEIADPVKKWKRIVRRVNIELEDLGKETIKERILHDYCYNATNGEKAQPPKLTIYYIALFPEDWQYESSVK